MADRAESIPRNTFFALAMRIVGALFTGGLTLFLTRYLGPDDFGVYALAVGAGALLILPADFGISRSAARFIAERRHDDTEVVGVLRHALRLKLLGAGIGAAVLIAAAGPIANAYGTSELEWPLRVMGIAMAGQSLMLLFTTTFEALGRNILGFRLAFSESALEVTATVALVLAGAGVVGATAGRAFAYSMAALIGLLITLRALGRRSLRGPPPTGLSLRTIATYAGALLVIDSAFTAFGYVDTLMIGALLDPEAAGLFSAPYQVLSFATYLSLALAAAVGPRLARGEGREPDVDSLQRALRLVLAFQFVLVAPIVVWAAPITDLLFGSEYAESADVFRALGPYVLMVGPVPILALSVNYLGEARRRVPLALGALAINVILDLILIPEIGVVAGAIATDVAFLFFLVGHFVIARNLIDLRVRPFVGTLLRGALAAAAMAGVLFAFGTSDLSPIDWIAGGTLATAAYAAVLLLTREFTSEELRSALAVVGRR
jgi:O-antigen/teichoic acid export membrane protein